MRYARVQRIKLSRASAPVSVFPQPALLQHVRLVQFTADISPSSWVITGVVIVAQVFVPVRPSKIDVGALRDRSVETSIALFKNPSCGFFLLRMNRPRFFIAASPASHYLERIFDKAFRTLCRLKPPRSTPSAARCSTFRPITFKRFLTLEAISVSFHGRRSLRRPNAL